MNPMLYHIFNYFTFELLKCHLFRSRQIASQCCRIFLYLRILTLGYYNLSLYVKNWWKLLHQNHCVQYDSKYKSTQCSYFVKFVCLHLSNCYSNKPIAINISPRLLSISYLNVESAGMRGPRNLLPLHHLKLLKSKQFISCTYSICSIKS